MATTVMTFNTQHCMSYITKQINFDLFANTIEKIGAEIIGLNEMRNTGKDPEYQAQAQILADKLGYYSYFAKAIEFQGTNPYGNALISKYPILSAQTIPVPDPEVQKYDGYYETRCLLKATIDAPDGPLTVCIIHWGLNPDEQENAVQTILSNIEDKRCILMGDFNVSPEDKLLAPIREKMFDTAELFGGELLSWPSDNPNIKIDYLFTSPDLKVTAADIPPIVVSDHRPYIAVIQ